MWLLSTDRAELHYFPRSFDAVGGYAILSHTWEGNEQTLQEVRAIGERCAQSGSNPRDDSNLSPKIRGCCEVAEADGYQWVWIDSCCIDKTSSSELSESINSMYQWYAASEVCYAYLADVPDACALDAPGSVFRNSRWHTRGWTLQELIAPEHLLFLSDDWKELGNRKDLANLLEEITQVPAAIFLGEKKAPEYSIAQRMCWASRRKTTRREDEAYCLMGIFGVAMPANYGEGERAFTRLQYEILRHSEDMSIFAFGSVNHLQGEFKLRGISFHPEIRITHPHKYLLATSPRDFVPAWPVVPAWSVANSYTSTSAQPSEAPTGPFGSIQLPRISVTSYGIKLRLPVFEHAGATVAVLLCKSSNGYLGMLLARDPSGEDPTRPRYYASCCAKHESKTPVNLSYRLTLLGRDLRNLRFNGESVKAEWRTIYMVSVPVDVCPGKSITRLSIGKNSHTSFILPQWLFSRILVLNYNIERPINYSNLTVLQFLRRYTGRGGTIYLFLGLCPNADHAHWANAVVWDDQPTKSMKEMAVHSCPEDHVDSWKESTRTFGSEQRMIQLSFKQHRRDPWTRVMHIEFLGTVFQERLKEVNISIPTFRDLQFVPSSSESSSSSPRVKRGTSQKQNESGNPADAEAQQSPITKQDDLLEA